MTNETKKLVEEFLVKGFFNANPKNNGIRHGYVLNDLRDNLINPKTCTLRVCELHEKISSLKSSQAFAYNLFSDVPNVEFEVKFETLKKSPAPAQPDVMVTKDRVVTIYEVKAFELEHQETGHSLTGKFADAYFDPKRYFNQTTAEHFINFIKSVQEAFKSGPAIYAEGIKQLCCHLLGIVNSLETKLKGKDVELFSLCFDNMQNLGEYKGWLEQYKKDLNVFMPIANEMLDNLTGGRVKYCGYKGAIELLATEHIGKNLDYIIKRYY